MGINPLYQHTEEAVLLPRSGKGQSQSPCAPQAANNNFKDFDSRLSKAHKKATPTSAPPRGAPPPADDLATTAPRPPRGLRLVLRTLVVRHPMGSG